MLITCRTLATFLVQSGEVTSGGKNKLSLSPFSRVCPPMWKPCLCDLCNVQLHFKKVDESSLRLKFSPAIMWYPCLIWNQSNMPTIEILIDSIWLFGTAPSCNWLIIYQLFGKYSMKYQARWIFLYDYSKSNALDVFKYWLNIKYFNRIADSLLPNCFYHAYIWQLRKVVCNLWW